MIATTPNPLSNGVRAIAALFALCGIYLAILAAFMLARPGTISMSAGAPLLFGLELAGPYMFLLMAAGGRRCSLWTPQAQQHHSPRRDADRHHRNRNVDSRPSRQPPLRPT